MKNSTETDFSAQVREYIGIRANNIELGLVALCVVIMAFVAMFYYLNVYLIAVPLILFAALYLFTSFYFEETKEAENIHIMVFFHKLGHMSLAVLCIGLLFFVLSFPNAKMMMVVGTLSCIGCFSYYIYHTVVHQEVFFRVLIRLIFFSALGTAGIYYS